jgi:hypothetical protein
VRSILDKSNQVAINRDALEWPRSANVRPTKNSIVSLLNDADRTWSSVSSMLVYVLLVECSIPTFIPTNSPDRNGHRQTLPNANLAQLIEVLGYFRCLWTPVDGDLVPVEGTKSRT